jgi:hypothetical protein
MYTHTYTYAYLCILVCACSTASDEQWHQYHDERRALELVHEAFEEKSKKPYDEKEEGVTSFMVKEGCVCV